MNLSGGCDRSRRNLLWAAALLVAVAGCGFSVTCPPGSPANDLSNRPIARRANLPGVWQISFVGNLAVEGVFGWKFGPGDHFISFDADGLPLHEGVLAPGNDVALYQWNLQTGVAAPSQAAAGSPDRLNAAVDVIERTDGTLTIEIRYREPFQSRFDLGDTDVVVTYENMQFNPQRDTLTGLRRERREYADARIPLPPTEDVVWRVALRRVDADLTAEPPDLAVLADVVPQDAATEPYPVGQGFDLVGTLDSAATPSPRPSRWVWIIYRTVRDGEGSIVDRQQVAELEGDTATFTADQPGTYTVRLWATDGAHWTAATPVELDVQ